MWCAWMYNRRKFRSQLSDNMDRWKAEMGREEERRSKRESLRRKKIQVREKVGKSRNIMFFQWFVALEGRKVGSLKRRVSKSKCTKHATSGPLLEVEMSKKCAPLWCEAHFEVKSAKNCGVRSTFGRSDVVSRGRCKGLCTLSKVSKTWEFCSISKTWQVQHFTQMEWKIAKRIGARSSALHSTFNFWRMSRRMVSFLTLSTSKIEEVSQNCLVFDVVKFKNWGRLVDIVLRFWCCQVQKLRKSRIIASFWMLPSSKLKKSLRIAAFSGLQLDRQTGRQTDR